MYGKMLSGENKTSQLTHRLFGLWALNRTVFLKSTTGQNTTKVHSNILSSSQGKAYSKLVISPFTTHTHTHFQATLLQVNAQIWQKRRKISSVSPTQTQTHWTKPKTCKAAASVSLQPVPRSFLLHSTSRQSNRWKPSWRTLAVPKAIISHTIATCTII